MEEVYLKSLGKLTIKEMTDKEDYIFCEIPNTVFEHKYISENSLNRDEYINMNYDQSSLKESIDKRGIQYIYHITPIDNLKLILTKGILPRIYLYDKYRTGNFKDDFITARFPSALSDPNRFDNLYNSTSFSISSINEYVLNAYLKRYVGRKYCILKLNANLLVNMYGKEFFFYHNSSSGAFKGDKYKYKNGKYFNYMFYNKVVCGNKEYKRNNYAGNLTTSRQAEVMINSIISPNLIVDVLFFDEEDYKNYISKYGQLNVKHLVINNNNTCIN